MALLYLWVFWGQKQEKKKETTSIFLKMKIALHNEVCVLCSKQENYEENLSYVMEDDDYFWFVELYPLNKVVVDWTKLQFCEYS